MILIMLYLTSTYFLSSKNVINEYTIDSIIAALYKLKARSGVHMRHRVNDNRKMIMLFFFHMSFILGISWITNSLLRTQFIISILVFQNKPLLILVKSECIARSCAIT